MKKEKITYQLKLDANKEALFINGNLISKISLKKGIATIHNGSTGTGHSCHPNIHKSGSVKGMINKGYWSRTDKIIKRGGYKYNVSHIVVSGSLDLICQLIEEGKIDLNFFHHNATTEPQTLNPYNNLIFTL